MRRRVVVTGIGMVIPQGAGKDEVWKKICEGVSGVGPITKFDPTGFETRIAAEVRDFDPARFIDPKDLRKMDPFIHFAIGAACIATEDSGIDFSKEDPERVGVIIGVGLGGLATLEQSFQVLRDRGPKRISPFFIPAIIPNEAPAHISIRFGLKGPNMAVATACASGAHAIGMAFRAIQYGDIDVAVSGGVEATITPLAVAGFNAMRALSTRNDEPQKASRPFDRDRDGFVIGEGGAVMILEELERAKKRGAQIYAELVGYGYNSDAYHLAAPDPEGEGAARCMLLALKDARLSPEDVDYINAHGTGTPAGDLTETIAIKRVFGPRAYKIPVSSTKSMTGHLLGGAGSTEAVFCVLSIRDGIIPPTINYENPDPECDLDYVPNVAREAKVRVALSNSFGFGGANAVLIFKKFEG